MLETLIQEEYWSNNKSMLHTGRAIMDFGFGFWFRIGNIRPEYG